LTRRVASRTKRLGQNFLVDRRAAARIVAALAPSADHAVLEIGPGRGALTDELIAVAGRIAAVEVDAALAQTMRRRHPTERLVLLQQSVLQLDLRSVSGCLDHPPAGELSIVGNLPYSISKPIAMKLVRERASVHRAVLMFQREVAQRLTAEPGAREYGPLSILTGQTYLIRKLFDLPPAAFRPRPRVTSSVTHWRRRPLGTLTADEEQALRGVLAVCFRRRRQTLRNNLRAALGADGSAALLQAASLDGSLRAEAIPPAGFRRLAELWDGSL
jgi:16S rRNA (adenine1518-N6/adenine1519-N6)-dimethyltransferase